MGAHGGYNQGIKGLTFYTLSSTEMKVVSDVFKGVFSKWNRKVRGNFFDVVPAVALGGFAYWFGHHQYHENKVHHRS